MPVMDGFAVLEALRQRDDWVRIPVLVVSSCEYPLEDFFGAVCRVLRKPVEFDHLLESITFALATTPSAGPARSPGSTS